MLLLLLPQASPWSDRLAVFDRLQLNSLYWPAVFLLIAPAFAFAALQTRRAAADERRRVTIMLAGLIFGVVPEITVTLISTIATPFSNWLSTPTGIWFLFLGVSLPELTIPVTTAYAVLVHRALDVQTLLRRALQYALARYSILLVAATPFVIVIVALYINRHLTLADLLRRPVGLLLGAIAVLGLSALRYRDRALLILDRRFFRDQYDAQEILKDLVDECRTAQNAVDLVARVGAGLERALHPTRVELLLVDRFDSGLCAVSGALPRLQFATQLAHVLSSATSPLDVAWTRPAEWVRALPLADKEWLLDGAFHLLVPLRSKQSKLVGVLGLGEKQSGLPYSRPDRLLLETVANAIALAVGEMDTPLPVAAAEPDAAASECPMCASVWPAGKRLCGHCGTGTTSAALPHLLSGKFSVLQRLGSGDMGVVYRAVDLELGRQVALKTLPRMAPREVARLRREARAMAGFVHPNLAIILAVESWRGIPVLVMEYLAAGTVADRLRSGPLGCVEAIELGIALASALDRLHSASLLHRDINPVTSA